MKILIVGAGAVGLVYGHHFTKAGHEIIFLVKEKYQAQLNQEREGIKNNDAGIVLYQLNNDKSLLSPQFFKKFESINSWHQAKNFDLIVLAISSNALRQLPVEEIAAQLKQTHANLLMLQPSTVDLEYLTQTIPKEKIFHGIISIVSYQTDEINSRINPIGTAYYLPPVSMPISANNNAIKTQKDNLLTITALFNDSGIRAKAVKNTMKDARIPAAFLMTFLCALEAANWEFKYLSQSKVLLKKLSAAQQSLLPEQIMGSGFSASFKRSSLRLLLKACLRPALYRLLLKISPCFVPLPLEAFLKQHFLKVRPQTVIYMQEYQELCPSKAVIELTQLLHLTTR